MSLKSAILTRDVAELPSRRDEDWRWTDLRGLIRSLPEPSPEADRAAIPAGPFAALSPDDEIVVANGRPSASGTYLVPADERLLWPAQAQFNRFCFYPLHLYAAGQPELARARLADLALGVGPGLASRALPLSYRLAHPKLALGLVANRAAEKLTENPRGVGRRAAKTAPQGRVVGNDASALQSCAAAWRLADS